MLSNIYILSSNRYIPPKSGTFPIWGYICWVTFISVGEQSYIPSVYLSAVCWATLIYVGYICWVYMLGVYIG